MSINNNISKFANTVDSSGQIDFADLANKPTTLAGYGITDGASGGSVTSYTNASDLPLSGNSAGDLAYVVETNRMYVNTGSGWYSISLVNTNPSITSVQDASSNTTPFTFATDGTATVITITASDPEDIPLTYSYSVTSGSLTNGGGTTATVTQGTGSNTNVFTVTPSTTEAYAGNFTLTFTVSDGVNTSTSANSFSLQFSISNSNYTTLLLQADASSSDNQVDASSNSLTITETGDATSTAFTPYHPKGYSAYFDGSGDNLTIADDASLDLSTGDFTIEAWIWVDSTNVDNAGIISKRSLSQFNAGQWRISFLTATNKLAIAHNSENVNKSTPALTLNAWNHIAFCRSGTTLYCLANGTLGDTDTSYGHNFDNSESLYIGLNATLAFKGYMADVRILKGTALYTSSYDIPTERLTSITNTSLLTCHLPYIADGSSNDHSITVNGNTKTELFSPYDQTASYSKSSYGGSVYFDRSSGSALEIPYNSGFAFDGDFTIETWMYHVSHSSNYTGIIANANDNVQYGPTSGFSLSFYALTDRLSFQIGDGLSITTPNAISKNVWTHIAVVRSGSTITVYVNGVAETSGSSSATIDAGSSYDLYLARGRASTSVPYVTCYLSDTRIVKGTAVYTSDFTPPTSPLTAISGTQLLTCTNKHEVWDAAGGDTLILNSSADTSTSQTKFASSNVSFSNTSSGDSDNLEGTFPDLGDIDYTIELWVYFNSIHSANSAHTSLLDARDGTTYPNNPVIWEKDNVLALYQGAWDIEGTTTLSTNTWYHVALTRQSGTSRLFLNGTLEGSTTTTQTYYASTFELGNYNSNYGLDGYIEDFRITKGLARYTSNFTPPTAALEG